MKDKRKMVKKCEISLSDWFIDVLTITYELCIYRKKKNAMQIIETMWHAALSLVLINFLDNVWVYFSFCDCGASHSARSFLLHDMISGQRPWCATSWWLCIFYHLYLLLVALETWNVGFLHHYPFSLCYNFVWGLYDPHIVLVGWRKKSTPLARIL